MKTPGLGIPQPAPFPAGEAALLQNQLGLLNQSQAGLQGAMGAGQAYGPALLGRAGIQVTPGAAGQPPSITDLYADAIKGLSGQGLTLAGAAQALQQQGVGALAGTPTPGPLGAGVGAALGNAPLAQAYQQRALAALAGQVPVDPALVQQLRDQATGFEAQQRAQWGPGYQGATPYQNAKYYQDLYQTNALDAARRADISTAVGGANAAMGGMGQGLASSLGLTQGLGNLYSQGAGSVGNIGNLAQPFGAAQGLTAGPAQAMGQLSQLYQSPIGAHQTQQFLAYQNALNKYNADAYQRALLFSGGANLAGLGLTSPLFSSTTHEPTNLLGLGVNALRGLFGGGTGTTKDSFLPPAGRDALTNPSGDAGIFSLPGSFAPPDISSLGEPGSMETPPSDMFAGMFSTSGGGSQGLNFNPSLAAIPWPLGGGPGSAGMFSTRGGGSQGIDFSQLWNQGGADQTNFAL